YIVDVMTGQNAAAAAPGSIEAEIAAAKNSGLDAAVPGSVTVSGPSERPEPAANDAENKLPKAVSNAPVAFDQAAAADTSDQKDDDATAETEMPQKSAASAPDAAPRVPAEASPDDAERAAPQDASTDVANIDDVEPIRVETRRIGDNIKLIFPFAVDTSAAVFRRGMTLWMVFDSATPLDVSAIEANLGDLAGGVTVASHSDWQTVRIDLARPRLATFGSEGSNWIVTIGDMILAPSRPLSAERVTTDAGDAILRIPFERGVAVRRIDDKTVGDQIIAITGFGPPRGFLRSLEFVDMKILSSAHGIALVPTVDNLQAAVDLDDVILSRDSGLTLSNTTFRAVNPFADAVPDVDRSSIIDFSSWRAGGVIEFRDRLNELHNALASVPLESREPSRLNLIRFLIANGFAYEALGQIRVAQGQNPHLENDPALLVHEAAANVIAGRMQDALKVLDASVLQKDPDAMIWRLLASAGQQQWSAVRQILPKISPYLPGYPSDIRADVSLAGVEAAVEANDFATAIAELSEIDRADIDKKQALRLSVLEARIADASGRADEALGRYDHVIKAGERRYAAEALYRKTKQQFRDGKLNTTEGVEALEELTTVWRGDDIELDALGLLAKLYMEADQFSDGFRTMRTAVHIAPESVKTRLLQDEMAEVFSELFLDGKADDMPPVEALSLYYDYRELTPIGRRGDEMVRRLAERLVGVDLLEQAEQLLAHQVENRLKGAARAEVAADLAVIYLMDHKPGEALRVLQKSRLSGLPDILERRRRLVEARALASTGRIEIAIDLLRSLKGPDIDRTRADILWSSERWQQAGEQIERMYGSVWSKADALKSAEQIDLMRAAIAFALADDRIGLGRLRSKYAKKMAESPYASAFDVVTGPIESKGVEFQSVVRAIASVDTLQAFLSEYRTHYAEPDAKSTNG
ncbi:MAG: hypothetical protein KDJ16_17550, partial [Hyphomicrobiales bacterium]|nr:hypothetical protein [Hyphomicrobiales bacterium]